MNTFFHFSFYILIIIVNIFYPNSSFIVLSFNTYQDNQENWNKELNTTLFFEHYFPNIIYTQIEVGSPKKLMPIIITSNAYGLSIGYLCNHIFDKKESLYNNNSKTFYRESNNFIKFPKYKGGYYAKDSFTFSTNFENNSNNKSTIYNMSFIYMPKE